MATSTFKKLNRDILLEFVYDGNNVITEPYYILTNSRTGIKSYIAGDTSISGNTIDHQLFNIDKVSNKFSLVDTSKYNFLSKQEFTPNIGIRHDTLKMYLPNNFNFGTYEGFYLRVYTYDINNKKIYELSNYLFDRNIHSNLLSKITPVLYFEDRLWDNYLQINIPSVYALGLQRSGANVNSNTINQNLTNGVGISQTSPIFLDFQFIAKKTTVGTLVSYFTSPPKTTQIPQTPELEELRLKILPSSIGDYFEIYSTYNNSFDEYVTFIENSKKVSKVYVAEYTITLYEENIKGKSTTFVINSDFYEKVEWRPVLKYATSTAQIDVEMKLINLVDSSIVVRKGAYGFKPEEISKYGLRFRKVKVRNVHKPKIYTKKTTLIESQSILGRNPLPENVVQVPFPVLSDLGNICAYSKQALNKINLTGKEIDKFLSNGKLKIGIGPFDNIIDITLAFKVNNLLEHVDLTSCQNLKISFKTSDTILEFPLYFDKNSNPDKRNNPKFGKCIFKIPSSKFLDIKKLSKENKNLFYITTLNQNIKTVLYTGIFGVTDNSSGLDISSLMQSNNGIGGYGQGGSIGAGLAESIIDDDTQVGQEVAIVTRKKISVQTNPNTSNPKEQASQILSGKDKFKLNNLSIGTFSSI